MENKTLNILIGGEAGQGLVTLGTLLSKAFVRHGYKICVTQGYQSRIRGGHNTFSIRINNHDVAAPSEAVDMLIALTEETVELHNHILKPDGLIVCDAAFANMPDGALKVPYKDLASKKFENTAALGVISSLVGLEESLLENLLRDLFGKKGEDIISQNKDALVSAYKWASNQADIHRKLPESTPTADKLMMNGNEAIAFGALTAGVKFCSFYPMTPATSINLTLAKFSQKTGLIVEQAEDEIAAINMVLGASFAGAPSMTATSGGGFALMVEGVSLAAMTETPVVIVISQRPGPATGLPTRTEQADLEFVLHSGHGEFPRAIFAPGSVEECFYLTRRAFELAEETQSPVFVLTDQFLADSYRSVDPFPVSDLSQVKPGTESKGGDETYKRFKLTEDGISPRLLPGVSQNLVVADSDEHTEDGHLTEDLRVRIDMVQKRFKKGKILDENFIVPSYFGDENAEILFVSWGSTKGSVEEAAQILKANGKSAASLHFSQVWPLVPEKFLSILQKSKTVIAVEGNATGQFAKLIRRETGFGIERKIVRYDGLQITPEYILDNLSGL